MSKKLLKMKFRSHTYQAKLELNRQGYYFVLDSILIKSMQCAYFHEIIFKKVYEKKGKGRPMITFKKMVLA